MFINLEKNLTTTQTTALVRQDVKINKLEYNLQFEILYTQSQILAALEKLRQLSSLT